MGIADVLADKLAARVIAYVEMTGDEAMIGIMSQTPSETSKPLQKAFVTSVRVRGADRQIEARIAAFAAADGTADVFA